jgi:hypothetical protein
MNPIQEAIKEIESRDPGEQFSYQQIAKKYSVNRVTLMRRHKHETEDYGVRNQSLHPEREAELVRYIETLTERRLPVSWLANRSPKAGLTGISAGIPTISSLARAKPWPRSGQKLIQEPSTACTSSCYIKKSRSTTSNQYIYSI